MKNTKPKTIHEAFSRFFELPNRETLRDLLREHVGELRSCDFKESWPEHSALAKHLLGIANAGGGCLVVGVKENPDKTAAPEGLAAIRDKADIFNGIKNYLPEPLLSAVEIADFSYQASEYPSLVGKMFQVVFVHSRPESLPFVMQRAGSGIRAAAIYIRREGSTEEANYDEVQRLLNERLAASPQTAEARDLKEHLEELKVLYGEIPKTILGRSAYQEALDRTYSGLFGAPKNNPHYPKEEYEAFLVRMLEEKKKLIESLVAGRK
jgi:predicted HTH transcriptional regulator